VTLEIVIEGQKIAKNRYSSKSRIQIKKKKPAFLRFPGVLKKNHTFLSRKFGKRRAQSPGKTGFWPVWDEFES